MPRWFRYSLVFFFSVITSLSPAFASPSPSDYGALPTVQNMAISPNGELVAYRKTSESKDAVVVTSLKEKKLILATEISKLQIENIYFLNDKQLFIRASEYKRIDGNVHKYDISTAFLLNIDDKKFRQLLIPGDTIYANQTGLGGLVGVTPDLNYALMPAYADTPDPHFPDPLHHLYKVDLRKKSLSIAVQGTKYTRDFFVDGNGSPIAIEDFDEKQNIHSIRAIQNKKSVEIFKETTDIRTKNFVGLTPDFKSLVFIQSDEATGHDSYNLMKLDDGTITTLPFSRDDADIEYVIYDLQRVVHGVVYSGLTPSYKFFDASLDQRIRKILDNFPDQSVQIASWSPDWKQILVNVEGSNYVDDYFLFSDSKEPIFITSGRSQIKASDINPLGKIAFSSRDSVKIPTILTIPKDKSENLKNLPAIIYPHGGPAAHDSIGFDYFAQALASQGYLVIQPQFRGSDGFGYKFRDAGHGEWGKKMQDDLSDAVKFFANKGIIDPKRVCIVGASYGGYAALTGGALTPDLYKCVVSINGVSNLNKMLSYEKNVNGRDSESVAYWKIQFGGENDINKDELDKVSAENNAKNFIAPTLLIYSTHDKIVDPDQSLNMLDALKRHKKPVEIVKLEGDDHHLQKGPTRTEAVEAVIKFVNTHLK